MENTMEMRNELSENELDMVVGGTLDEWAQDHALELCIAVGIMAFTAGAGLGIAGPLFAAKLLVAEAGVAALGYSIKDMIEEE